MRAVLYLAAMAFTVYVMFMYDAPWCMELLMILLVLLAASAVVAFRMKYAVSAEFSVKNNVVRKNDKIPVYLTVTNSSVLPVPRMKVHICIRQEGGRSQKICSAACAADSHGRTHMTFYLETDRCGVTGLQVSGVTVRDYLGLFKMKRRCDAGAEVIVIPEIYPVSLSVLSDFRYFTGEGDVFSETEAGDDPSEVFEIREYRPGDKIQKIHWKLSARMDALYVRDYSEPSGYAIALVGDFKSAAPEETDEDAVMSALFSVSVQLVSDGYTHYFAWLGRDGVWSRFRIGSEAAVYKAMPYMMKMMSGIRYAENQEAPETEGSLLQTDAPDKAFVRGMPGDTAQDYNEQFGRASYHTMLRIDTALNVYYNEALVMQLDKNNIRESLLNMNLEI